MSVERRIWASNRVKYWCMRALEKYQITLTPSVHFDLKTRRINGQATGSRKVDFNEQILNDIGDDFDQTIGHEVAHLIVSKMREISHRYVRMYDDAHRAHGRLWKQVMHELGLEVARHSNYDLTLLIKPGDIIYGCKCRDMIITRRTHHQILLGSKRHCKLCKETIQYKGVHK